MRVRVVPLHSRDVFAKIRVGFALSHARKSVLGEEERVRQKMFKFDSDVSHSPVYWYSVWDILVPSQRHAPRARERGVYGFELDRTLETRLGV